MMDAPATITDGAEHVEDDVDGDNDKIKTTTATMNRESQVDRQRKKQTQTQTNAHTTFIHNHTPTEKYSTKDSANNGHLTIRELLHGKMLANTEKFITARRKPTDTQNTQRQTHREKNTSKANPYTHRQTHNATPSQKRQSA